MDEAAVTWELATAFDVSADEAREAISQTKQVALVVREGFYMLVPEERVGMYVVRDDLPTPEELDDGGECDWFIANSRVKD